MTVWVVSNSWQDEYNFGASFNIFETYEKAKKEFDMLAEEEKQNYQDFDTCEIWETENSVSISSNSGFNEFNVYIEISQKEVY